TPRGGCSCPPPSRRSCSGCSPTSAPSTPPAPTRRTSSPCSNGFRCWRRTTSSPARSAASAGPSGSRPRPSAGPTRPTDGLRLYRELHHEFRAAGGPVLDPQRPARGLDQAPADGEPEPRALADLLGRRERLEEPIPDLGRDPRAVVLDLEAHPVLTAPRGAERDPAAGARHRVGRVEQEVEQHLDDALARERHPREIRG